MQLDLFGLPPTTSSLSSAATLTASSSAQSPIVGLKVRLTRPCRCGGNIGIIGSSTGPHPHRIECARCNSFCRWMGERESAFITKIVTTFGCPPTPIVVREWQHV